MPHNFVICNADTDSIAFRKKDHKEFSTEECNKLLEEINSLMEPLIKWENDGQFKKFIVVSAKNYILQVESGKIKIKGASLKATTKEKALQKFIKEVIDLLLTDRKSELQSLYHAYVKRIMKIEDITEWCSKITITKAVLTSKGTRQKNIRNALDMSTVTEGDKVYMFVEKTLEESTLVNGKTKKKKIQVLKLREDFEGQYDVSNLHKKLFDTLKVFKSLIDIKAFPNFKLKHNQKLLSNPS